MTQTQTQYDLDGGHRPSWASLFLNMRTSVGIGQRDFADILRISRSTLGRIERGEVDPTLATIRLLLRHMGASITVVRSGSGKS